jgi:hypothetical protein
MKWKVIAIAFGAIVFTSTIHAQTPDGQTPADEGVCDLESGAAYGLCVSYCEAMDCDSSEAVASSEACQNRFNRFFDLTGQEPPCESPPPAESLCPCSTNWQHLELFPDPNSATFSGCSYSEVLDPYILLQIGKQDTSEQYRMIAANTDSEVGDELSQCYSYSGSEWSGNDLEGGVVLQNIYPESSEMFDQMQDAFYEACFQEVVKIAEHFGIECIPNE